MADFQNPLIMVNGLPGRMATLIAQYLMKKNLGLSRFSLTGPEIQEDDVEIKVEGERSEIITLINPSERENYLPKILVEKLIAIDFTHPDAADENVAFYCDNKIPFVMGTTGGKLRGIYSKMVAAAGISAVIAPNMAAPVIMLMDAIEYLTKTYPEALAGWNISIDESHQSSKPDPSGTALAIGKKLLELGVKFKGPENIHMVRDPIKQKVMGVPTEDLAGHGWHTYNIVSPDNKVVIGFKHNISGRSPYVDGTIKALNFLGRKLTNGEKGCYSMLDVMKG